MSAVKKLTVSAVCMTLCLLLPFLTGQLQQIGNMFCPMHLPVLICGLLCGPAWGAGVGLIAPLLRYLLFSAPSIFPIGLAMAAELAVYGLVTGLVYPRTRGDLRGIYLALGSAMVSGRLVWGAVRYALAGLSGSQFPMAAFLSGALFTAWPGILLQLILIPPVIRALQRSRLMSAPMN